MAAELGLLEGQDVGPGDVTHVDPVEDAGGWDGVALLPLALDEGDEQRVGRVDAREAGEVVDHGAQDQRRVDGDEVELGAAGRVVDDAPRRLLGERLGRPVGGRRVLVDVVDGHGVPRLLGEGRVGVLGLGGVDDGGERRRHHHTPDAGSRPHDGPKDPGGADDGRVDEVLLGVCDVEVEGGSCVEHDLEAGCLDDLIERVWLGDIWDYDRLQSVLAQAGVGVVDLLCLVLGADGGHDVVAPLEEVLEDMSGDEAGATCGRAISIVGQL